MKAKYYISVFSVLLLAAMHVKTWYAGDVNHVNGDKRKKAMPHPEAVSKLKL